MRNRVLLGTGANPLWKNSRGTSVFHLLAKRDLVELGELCLSAASASKRAGALNAAAGPGGWTPLMAACDAGRMDFARWAVAKGASVNVAMDTGEQIAKIPFSSTDRI